MGGIGGFASKHTYASPVLENMMSLMSARLPDGGMTIYLDDGTYSVGMGSKDAPFTTPDGRYIVAFDGTLYNYDILRDILDLPKNITYSAVMAFLWAQKGIKGLLEIDGMFAMAVWDRDKETLYLMRDRLGECPLYYYEHEGSIAFASTSGGLTAYPGFDKAIRTDVLGRYLFHQYLAAPDCIYENVYKLRGGQVLAFRNGQCRLSTYWDAIKSYHSHKHVQMKPVSYDQAQDMLVSVLKETLRRRLPKEGSVCAFLSGGYDSSLITALACELSGRPVHTFTISCGNGHYDEAPFAAKISRHLGTKHHEYTLGETEVRDMVARIPEVYDEPFADSSQIPTQLVCLMARKYGRFALAGDGSDEFFGGYSKYQLIRTAQMLDPVGELLHKLVAPMGVLQMLPGKVRAVIENRNPNEKVQVGGIRRREVCSALTPQGMDILYDESELHERDWAKRYMLLDQTKYLQDNGTVKVERAAASCGLSVRSPFFSPEVIKCAYALPHIYKIKGNVGKRIIKDLAYGYVPRPLLDREKHGFSLPIGKWMDVLFRDELISVSRADVLSGQGLFAPRTMQKYIDAFLKNEFGEQRTDDIMASVWAFYVFQIWYRRWIGAI